MNAMDGRKTGQQTVLALNVLAERQTISAENLPSQGNTLGSADQDEELKERISRHKQKMLNTVTCNAGSGSGSKSESAERREI